MCSTKLLDSAILLDECVSKVVKKIDHLLGLFGLCQRLICEGTITGSHVVDAPCFIKAMPLSSGVSGCIMCGWWWGKISLGTRQGKFATVESSLCANVTSFSLEIGMLAFWANYLRFYSVNASLHCIKKLV